MTEIEAVELYTKYLLEKGVSFYPDGFPIFKQEWFVKTLPLQIAPFNKRQYYKGDKSKISICYFGKDEHLYPRVDKIFNEINVLKEYHSVCMMDISISPLMLDEVQKMNLLINLLFICVVAVNNIKIIPSFRTGDLETLYLLDRSVKNPNYWIMGAVGTQRVRSNSFYENLFRCKCMFLCPKTLLIYGKPNIHTLKCLEEYEINYKIYEDFRDLSYSEVIKYE